LETFNNNQRHGVWVPAFAGTTERPSPGRRIGLHRDDSGK
jgi:hypothetical protein